MASERLQSEVVANNRKTMEELKKHELVEKLQRLLKQANPNSTTQFVELEVLPIEQLQEFVEQAQETQRMKERAEQARIQTETMNDLK